MILELLKGSYMMTKKNKNESLATQFFINFPRRPMTNLDFVILNRLREQDKINSKKNQL
jgi:hypothetical protein